MGENAEASLTTEYLEIAKDEINSRLQGGGLLGNPLIRVATTIENGEINPETTNEVAIRIAAADAFECGLRQAGIFLLEPIMRLEITTPAEHLGDFVSDLQQRRGLINNTSNRGKLVAINALVPLGNLFGYSSAMRGLSQGRATCTMEPADYAPAPEEVQESFF